MRMQTDADPHIRIRLGTSDCPAILLRIRTDRHDTLQPDGPRPINRSITIPDKSLIVQMGMDIKHTV